MKPTARTTVVKADKLNETRRRIEQWRTSRPHGHAPMPPALWRAAVAAARKYGLYATTRALHIDYGALKKRLDAVGAEPSAVPTFLEIPLTRPVPTEAPAGYVIEIVGPRGTIRIHAPALALEQIATLTSVAWGAQ